MTARDAAIAVGLGTLAALLYLSLLTGSLGAVLLFNLTQLPLFVAGLWLGPKAVAIAGIAGSLASFIGGGERMALFFAGVFALPVGVLVFQALRWRADADGRVWWYPAGYLVACYVGLGILGILGSALLSSGDTGGLAGSAQQAADEATRAVFGGSVAEADRQAFAAAIASVLPAMVAIGWLLVLYANGAVAQFLLSRFGAAFRPSPKMGEIELPPWAPIAFAVLFGLAMLGSGIVRYVALNALIVSILAFVFAGLAVMHVWARRFSSPTAVLSAAYSVIFFFGWPLVAVVALGFLEQWVGLRRRLAPRGQGV
jgi:hypothetical protein